MATAIPSTSIPGITGVATFKHSAPRPALVGMRAISFGEPSGPWEMEHGVRKNITEGSPDAPCLEISQYGHWSFRWAVVAGNRTISVRVKQAVNSAPYPALIVRANSDIGVTEATATSAGGAGWVTIGPLAVTVATTGAVWVELWNYQSVAGALDLTPTPAYFDHIVVT